MSEAVGRSQRMRAEVLGFTLIEMAIVLTIIGLITAGILVGQTLLRQSQINSTMADVQRYTAAVKNFQQKYGSLPGDMANATSYWGTAGGGSGDNYTTSCASSQGTGTQTCNGDGNGQIGVTYATGSFNSSYEVMTVWKHLANAQMIQGTYVGYGTGSDVGCEYNNYCPQGRIGNSNYGLSYMGNLPTADSIYYAGNYGHAIFFGAPSTLTYAWWPNGPVLTTLEAQAFDSKFDDGAPSTGKILTYIYSSSPSFKCATSAATPAYNITATGLLCSLMFITGF